MQRQAAGAPAALPRTLKRLLYVAVFLIQCLQHHQCKQMHSWCRA